MSNKFKAANADMMVLQKPTTLKLHQLRKLTALGEGLRRTVKLKLQAN